MDIVFAGLSLFLVVSVVDFYIVFGIIYAIFWLTLPLYNAIFLLASESYQSTFIQSNFWGFIGFALI